MRHIHQPLLNAIGEFIEGYGKDERYKPILEGLQGVVGSLKDMGPTGDGGATPGQVAAKLAANPEAEVAKPEAAEPAEGEQPKNFADASAAAKERMVAAR